MPQTILDRKKIERSDNDEDAGLQYENGMRKRDRKAVDWAH